MSSETPRGLAFQRHDVVWIKKFQDESWANATLADVTKFADTGQKSVRVVDAAGERDIPRERALLACVGQDDVEDIAEVRATRLHSR
jgi:hypothetical protein